MSDRTGLPRRTGPPVDPRRPTEPGARQPATATPPQGPPARSAGRLRSLWKGFVAFLGALLGLAPHVLHHIGLLAGTALVAGTGGTALFAVIGLAASIPFLLSLKRRFRTWRAPAIGLGVFTVMFSLSAFVIGPAISGNGDDGGSRPGPAPTRSSPVPTQTTDEHSDHH